MNVELLLQKQETGMEILEGIKTFEGLRRLRRHSLKTFPGTFPELRRKYLHDIEIYDMCIARLFERFEKTRI